MVAVKTAELTSFLKSAPSRIDAFLIHGSDAGQVAELAKQVTGSLSAASSPPGEIIRLTDQDLAQSPGRLASEARMLTMFGGRQIILVKHNQQLTPKLFEELLSEPLAAYIVVEAGNLKRDAKIRQIFEKAKNAASIVCYGSDERSLTQMIQAEAANAGQSIAPDAVQRLTQLLGSDFAVSRAEVIKLTLYAAGQDIITLADVEAIVGDASAHAFDTAIEAALGGNARIALEQLDGLSNSGTPASVFLTVFSSYLQKLYALLAAMERGENFDSAATKLRPPMHFKQKDAMKAQSSRWRLAEISYAIDLAHEIMRQTRLKPALEHELVSDFVLRLARSKARGGATRAA